MIDFIINSRPKNEKEKIKEVIKDLSRIIDLENIPTKELTDISPIPKEIPSKIIQFLGPEAINVYSTIYSSILLKNSSLTTKYSLNKKQKKMIS
ncbi:hypothetical protein [Cyclobacterium qasimii]|uniref:Uncharacterized protein n=1 Tax=Cyclobacterium qasimii M12-11B TaxID=641524 RepID=S7V6B1_9BACT|nr:hypothetical protein [Cyclobacterium qasimii]EPR65476.1 hypothetical protein ADICYQ_5397 [Cyclobacterium qasimii M12-11B]